MKRKIIEQVKEQVFSRVDIYRSIRRTQSNIYLEMFCDIDYVLEQYYIDRETPILIDAEISILIADENLFIVEVYLEQSLFESFYFSLKNKNLVFDFESQVLYPMPEFKKHYYMSKQELEDAMILMQQEQEIKSKSIQGTESDQNLAEREFEDIELFPMELIPDDLRILAEMEPFIKYAKFEIKETEFREYEKDRANNFRIKKLQKLNAKSGRTKFK